MNAGRWVMRLLTFALSVFQGVSLSIAQDDVASVLSRIDPRSLATHIDLLEGDRSSPEAKARAAHYIETELIGIGFDVERESSLFSDSLVVRRIGSQYPHRTFIIGAHYDTVVGSPGADDNASGVAALIEIARAIADIDLHTTLELIFFADEESNLEGSHRLAVAHRQDGRDIIGVIVMDMIAYTCDRPGCQFALPNIPGCFEVSDATRTIGDFIGIVANRWSRSLLDHFLVTSTKYVAQLKTEWGVVRDTGVCLHDTRRSDHWPYWDAGYDALLITDTANFRNRNYHGPGDVKQHLNIAFTSLVAQSVLAAGLTMTIGPGPLPPPTADIPPRPTVTPLTEPAQHVLYGLNYSAGTYVVDAVGVRTARRIARIALPLRPSDLAVSEDGRTVYVVGAARDSSGEGISNHTSTLATIDTARHVVSDTITIDHPTSGLAFDSEGNRLAVSGWIGTPASATIELFDLDDLYSRPTRIDLSGSLADRPLVSSEGIAFVPLPDDDSVSVVSLRLEAELGLFHFGSRSLRAYGVRNGRLGLILSDSRGRVDIIDSGTRAIIASLVLATGSGSLAVAPDESLAFAVGGCQVIGLDEVCDPAISVINLRQLRVTKRIPLPDQEQGFCATMMPDGSAVFLTTLGGRVMRIDTKTLTVARSSLPFGCGEIAAVPIVLPTYTPTPLPSATPLVSPSATARPTTRTCAGDCDVDSEVTIVELVLAVSVALGERGTEECIAADVDADGSVSVDELLQAAQIVLLGCAQRS